MRNVIALLLAVILLPTPVLAGTVEGTVSLSSAPKKRPEGSKRRFSVPKGRGGYGDEERAPSTRVDEVRNVVVYLQGVKSQATPGEAEIDQKDRTFNPFVLPVLVGTRVKFPNSDRVFHSVYSESPAKKFQLPEYPRGESRTVEFDKPGVVKVFCGIHPRMSAYILVLDNPHFTQPDGNHRFKLDQVPPGSYLLKAWHPLLTGTSKPVVVGEKSLKVDLKL